MASKKPTVKEVKALTARVEELEIELAAAQAEAEEEQDIAAVARLEVEDLEDEAEFANEGLRKARATTVAAVALVVLALVVSLL